MESSAYQPIQSNLATNGNIETNMIRFPCPKCGKRLKAPAEKGGLVATCQKCGTKMPVPLLKEDECKLVPSRIAPPNGTEKSMAENLQNTPENISSTEGGLKSSIRNLAAFAGKQALLKKLEHLDLPSADYATGLKALSHKVASDRFPDLYAEILRIDSEVEELRKSPGIADKTAIPERLKQAGIAALKKVNVETLLLQRNKQVTALGSRFRTIENIDSMGELSQELDNAKALAQRIEALKTESAKLGKQKMGLASTRNVAFALTCLVILAGCWWLKGVLFNSKSPEAQVIQMAANLDSSHRAYVAKQAQIKKELGELQRKSNQDLQEARDRHDLKVKEQELELKKSRFDQERARQKLADIKEDEISKQKLQATLKEEAEQQDRKNLAERLFGNISFDPAKNVVLSDSLKRSGAKVELRGQHYAILKQFHEKKDWLGLIFYFSDIAGSYQHPGTVKIHHKYPHSSIIERAFRNLSERDSDETIMMLIKTNQAFSTEYPHKLCCITFPLSMDRSFCHRDGSFDYAVIFERHPDGIGYLHKWRPTDGLRIVFILKDNADERFLDQVTADFRQFRNTLEMKMKLGELDAQTMEIRLAAEMARLYDEILRWAKQH